MSAVEMMVVVVLEAVETVVEAQAMEGLVEREKARAVQVAAEGATGG